MRGAINLPLEPGRKELAWYVGQANVLGTNQVSPTVPMKVERDADFVAKRLWLVQWPSNPGVGTQDPNLALPSRANVILRDGGTKRGLSIIGGLARTLIPDANANHMAAGWLGLPSPFLIKANNNLFAEITNADAATTAWTGDLYLVAEGFKVYPGLPEEIPATVMAYAVPFDLNGNGSILSPTASGSAVTGQFIQVTNNGEGKMLVKGFKITIVDAAGLDKTSVIMPALGFNVTDSTSGSKAWIQNTNQGATTPFLPASLLNYNGTFFPFNTPRYIDPNGVISLQIVWPSNAASQAAIAAAATFPLNFDITFFGALLPR